MRGPALYASLNQLIPTLSQAFHISKIHLFPNHVCFRVEESSSTKCSPTKESHALTLLFIRHDENDKGLNNFHSFLLFLFMSSSSSTIYVHCFVFSSSSTFTSTRRRWPVRGASVTNLLIAQEYRQSISSIPGRLLGLLDKDGRHPHHQAHRMIRRSLKPFPQSVHLRLQASQQIYQHTTLSVP